LHNASFVGVGKTQIASLSFLLGARSFFLTSGAKQLQTTLTNGEVRAYENRWSACGTK